MFLKFKTYLLFEILISLINSKNTAPKKIPAPDHICVRKPIFEATNDVKNKKTVAKIKEKSFLNLSKANAINNSNAED